MHPYQRAIDFITEQGGKATQSQKPYRLLHKLAKAKGIYMHGSQAFIGKQFDLSARKMDALARDALKRYCNEGVFQIPDQFKYSERKNYRHDGDANANRNIWSSSNKAKQDMHAKEPVKYSFNTVSE